MGKSFIPIKSKPIKMPLQVYKEVSPTNAKAIKEIRYFTDILKNAFFECVSNKINETDIIM